MNKRWTLLVLLAAACGPPMLYDPAGQPVREPEFVAQAGGLWLAVDSSAAGIRAVVEIQMAAPEGRIQTWDRTGLKLWTGSGPAISPVRLRQGSVRCWPTAPRGVPCGANPDDPRVCRWQVEPLGAECYYIVCAEFTLERLPDPADPVVLNMGGSLTVLQLAAVK